MTSHWRPCRNCELRAHPQRAMPPENAAGGGVESHDLGDTGKTAVGRETGPCLGQAAWRRGHISKPAAAIGTSELWRAMGSRTYRWRASSGQSEQLVLEQLGISAQAEAGLWADVGNPKRGRGVGTVPPVWVVNRIARAEEGVYCRYSKRRRWVGCCSCCRGTTTTGARGQTPGFFSG